MATRKEKEALMELIGAALEVNGSNSRIDANVDISRSSVHLRISDPVEVYEKIDSPGGWDWLFWQDNAAYFSNDHFDEGDFIEKCREMTSVVIGFKNYQPSPRRGDQPSVEEVSL